MKNCKKNQFFNKQTNYCECVDHYQTLNIMTNECRCKDRKSQQINKDTGKCECKIKYQTYNNNGICDCININHKMNILGQCECNIKGLIYPECKNCEQNYTLIDGNCIDKNGNKYTKQKIMTNDNIKLNKINNAKKEKEEMLDDINKNTEKILFDNKKPIDKFTIKIKEKYYYFTNKYDAIIFKIIKILYIILVIAFLLKFFI